MKRFALLYTILFFTLVPLVAADLTIGVGDLRVEKDELSGYHIYIRKKTDIESVLLTETTKDPEGNESSYAYRTKEWNEINGDEIRYLDGKPLISEYAKFSIIDSSAQSDSVFGQAFHFYIPPELEYGYPWTRHGSVHVTKGTFINIRSFEKKYGDYSGLYTDNPFMFDFANEVLPTKDPILIDDYNPVAAETFEGIVSIGNGKMIYSKGPETIVQDIINSLDEINPKKIVDVVFAIDATGSMKDDIMQLRKELVPRLSEEFVKFGDIRIGLLLYRDYVDNYNYMGLPVKMFQFTSDVDTFFKSLNSFTILGTEGGDVPEAVYEALYACTEFYQWRIGAEKKVILIGDAEPHPKPRGTKQYTKDLVLSSSVRKDIQIDAIITPDDKSKRK